MDLRAERLLMTSRNTRRSYARDTEIQEVENDVADAFIEENHSQGAAKKNEKKHSLGIFKNDELLGVVQFCLPRTSKKHREYSLELLRLCFKKDVRVVGGGSKLIKHYIKNYDPDDFFTYQDATGELTDIYEQSGMRFVSQDKEKTYIVAPGVTLETGDRRSVLGIGYATRFGPDRILGTNIGEVFHPQDHETKPGKRKTNLEIFTEDLKWRIKKTAGDRVYEWINPNKTFYTYKLTAPKSDKYYFGVSHVKKPNASVEDCEQDGYYGSGASPHFTRWKKKHKNTIQKKIIAIHPNKSSAFNQEEELIGELYKTDKNCLNSVQGGKLHGLPKTYNIREKQCKIHGKTPFQGDSCCKCVKDSGTFEKFCSIHGLVKHQGNQCYHCMNTKSVRTKLCPIHGKTTHQGDSCNKCVADKNVTIKVCPEHGKGKFIGDKCYKCINTLSHSFKNCPKHGRTKFNGSACLRCVANKSINIRECPKHGMVKHRGDKCYTCEARKHISMKECPTHGVTKHKGTSCALCIAQRNKNIGICEIHGETKFSGKKCAKCIAIYTNHKRWHKDTKNPKCIYCNPSIL